MAESNRATPERIFISYRQDDTAYPAGWLYDRLAGHFSSGQVFKDIDSIELGDDFVDAITAAVGSCDVLLALIGNRWLTIADADGNRRIDDGNDFVRLEIEAALARNVRVIPILVEGAKMPRPDDLPPSIARLARRQALELSPNRFNSDLSRLLRVLDKMLSPSRAERQPERPLRSGVTRDESEELAIGRGGKSEAGHTRLSEAIAQSLQQARGTADWAIRGLADIAASLQMRETADNLREAREQLRSDTFRLIVMGSFKTGKSSLVNALLGADTWPVMVSAHKGPMVVDDLPATAVLTGVRYAEKPYVQAWRFDGQAEAWSFERYLRESALDIDEQVNQRRFQAIKEFEIGFPARLCREEVIVYDSPGLNADTSRTLITRAATGKSDAAIIVYRSDMPMGEGELIDAASVVAGGARVFNVINLWNGRRVDDRMRESIWNRYVRDHLAGPAWHNQELSIRDIYFIDAAQARDGRYDYDEDKVEASGLADFERALAKFLVRERHQVHLQKFATVADNLASAIEEQISQMQKAAQLDRETAKAIELNPREREERNRSIASLTETAAAVAQHRLALQRALVTAKQT